MVLVIITAYNAEVFIEESIKSVLNQSYQQFNLCIIDDASTDNTYKIIKDLSKTDKRIIVHRLSENKGTYYARNVALKKYISKYKYWVLHGADDIMHPNKLEKQITNIESNGYEAATCKYERINHKTKDVDRVVQSMSDCILYRKRVFNELGYYDSNTRFGGDSEYLYRFLLKFGKEKMYYSDEILYTAYNHKDNLTTKVPIGDRKRIKYVRKYKKLTINKVYNKFL